MTVGLPVTVLIATGPFEPDLSAARVARAIDRGLQAGGLPPSELCPLQAATGTDGDLRAELDALDFDARMRRSRAVVIGAARLDRRTLADSVAFELATRARQAGVPAYAVARESSLDSFEARIMDLGAIVLAGDARRLAAAGRRLARVL